MTWLLLGCALVIAAAFVGMLKLRKVSDRQWAEHLARERFKHYRRRHVQGGRRSGVMLRLEADVSEFKAAMEQVGTALERLRREQPWWRRVWWRFRSAVSR